MVAELAFFFFFFSLACFLRLSSSGYQQTLLGKGAVDEVVTLQSLLCPSSQNPANGAFQCNFIKDLQRANAFVTAFLKPDFAAQGMRSRWKTITGASDTGVSSTFLK